MSRFEENVYKILDSAGVLKYCEVRISRGELFDGVDLHFHNPIEMLWASRRIEYDLKSPYKVIDDIADAADYVRRAFHTVIAMRKAGVNI